MKIRITCTREEAGILLDILWKNYKDQIVSISGFYPNRGQTKLGRVYIETNTKEFMGYSDGYLLDFKM